MITPETTATAVSAWIAANTVITAAALVLAALAWWKVGRYMRQCRCVVTAQAKVIDRQADTAERMLPLLADRIDEPTQEFDAVADESIDEEPTGRHALVESTAFVPANGKLLTDQPPAYYFAQGGDAR